MKNSCPCKNCEQREIGCHGRCEGYLAFRANLDAVKKAKAEDSMGPSLTVQRAFRKKILAKKHGW